MQDLPIALFSQGNSTVFNSQTELLNLSTTFNNPTTWSFVFETLHNTKFMVNYLKVKNINDCVAPLGVLKKR